MYFSYCFICSLSFANPEPKKKKLSHNKLYKQQVCYWKSDYRQKNVHDLSFGGWVILMLEARQYGARQEKTPWDR